MLQNRVVERAGNVTRSVNNRAKLTNNPRRLQISGRTALGRRMLDLADAYANVLGGWPALSHVLAANVRKAAELTALAEQVRAQAMREGNVDPLAVVRLQGVADRAVRALRLDRFERDEGEAPSIESFLRLSPNAAECQQMPSNVAVSATEAVGARETKGVAGHRGARETRRPTGFRPPGKPSKGRPSKGGGKPA